MDRGRLERLAPLTGLLAIAVFIVAIVIFPDEPPGTDESREEVAKFWLDNDNAAQISAALATLAMVPFLWFAGSLRSVLRSAEGGTGRLASIVFAGMLAFAIAVATGAAIQWAIADAADDLPPESIQTLSPLVSGFFFPYVLGIAAWMLAIAVTVLRHGGLPKAIGWVSLVLGVLACTPIGWVSFLLAAPWVIAVSILLYRAQPAVAPPTAPASSPGSPS